MQVRTYETELLFSDERKQKETESSSAKHGSTKQQEYNT